MKTYRVEFYSGRIILAVCADNEKDASRAAYWLHPLSVEGAIKSIILTAEE